MIQLKLRGLAALGAFLIGFASLNAPTSQAAEAALGCEWQPECSLAFCLAINGGNPIPAGYWGIPITHPYCQGCINTLNAYAFCLNGGGSCSSTLASNAQSCATMCCLAMPGTNGEN